MKPDFVTLRHRTHEKIPVRSAAVSGAVYRATAESHRILAKDGRPDHRIPVPLA